MAQRVNDMTDRLFRMKPLRLRTLTATAVPLRSIPWDLCKKDMSSTIAEQKLWYIGAKRYNRVLDRALSFLTYWEYQRKARWDVGIIKNDSEGNPQLLTALIWWKSPQHRTGPATAPEDEFDSRRLDDPSVLHDLKRSIAAPHNNCVWSVAMFMLKLQLACLEHGCDLGSFRLSYNKPEIYALTTCGRAS